MLVSIELSFKIIHSYDMSTFCRYAFYYMPAQNSELELFGEQWLGWSLRSGCVIKSANITDRKSFIEAPQKYGFHGTLKPPFRLAGSTTLHQLVNEARLLCRSIKPFKRPSLSISKLGRFLALTPVNRSSELCSLAETLVIELDHFRSIPTKDELEKRRMVGLSRIQDKLLLKWGYPYVLDEFRFHLTLSGQVNNQQADTLKRELNDALTPECLAEEVVSSVGLVGEGDDGRFRLIERLALGLS